MPEILMWVIITLSIGFLIMDSLPKELSKKEKFLIVSVLLLIILVIVMIILIVVSIFTDTSTNYDYIPEPEQRHPYQDAWDKGIREGQENGGYWWW